MFSFLKSSHDPITIVCGVNDAYAKGLAVTIRSLLERTSAQIILYVIESDLQEETKQKLLDSWNTGHLTVHFVQPSEEHMRQLQLDEKRATAEYFRLLAPSIVPPDCKKLLYLDSDLLILRNITHLWKTDIADAPIAAAQDFGVPVVSSEPWGLADYAELGLPADEPYFSSGVMLINPIVWRENDIAKQVIHFTKTHAATVRLWEQDGLNALLHGQWKHLDIRWNVVLPSLQSFEWWKPDTWQKVHQKKVEHDPWIIHFAGPKPWESECDHAWKEQFFAVLDRTAWRGWRPST